MENWKDLYTEIATKLQTEVPGIKWIDLWHNQINFLEEEHPFPAPSLFLSFRALSANDRGKNIQDLNTQVDVYVFFETFADTFMGSFNQNSALEFLDATSLVNKALHGASGTNYTSMRKVAITPVDTGSAQNLYKVSFACLVTDESAAHINDDIVDEDGDGENEFSDYCLD